jgi:hypothetical protein
MAAVLALVLLPALIATVALTLLGISGDLTFGTAIAGLVFISLVTGVFVGTMRMTKRWEGAHGLHD